MRRPPAAPSKIFFVRNHVGRRRSTRQPSWASRAMCGWSVMETGTSIRQVGGVVLDAPNMPVYQPASAQDRRFMYMRTEQTVKFSAGWRRHRRGKKPSFSRPARNFLHPVDNPRYCLPGSLLGIFQKTTSLCLSIFAEEKNSGIFRRSLAACSWSCAWSIQRARKGDLLLRHESSLASPFRNARACELLE